jgi:hypothetical protein
MLRSLPAVSKVLNHASCRCRRFTLTPPVLFDSFSACVLLREGECMRMAWSNRRARDKSETFKGVRVDFASNKTRSRKVSWADTPETLLAGMSHERLRLIEPDGW